MGRFCFYRLFFLQLTRLGSFHVDDCSQSAGKITAAAHLRHLARRYSFPHLRLLVLVSIKTYTHSTRTNVKKLIILLLLGSPALFVRAQSENKHARLTQVPNEQLFNTSGLVLDAGNGTTVKLPRDWRVVNAEQSSTGEMAIQLRKNMADSHTGPAVYLYYRRFDKNAVPIDPSGWLKAQVAQKTTQRIKEGLSQYVVVNVDPETSNFHGLPALTWSANFSLKNGNLRTERFARICASKGSILFFVRAPAEASERVFAEFDALVAAAVIAQVNK